MIKKEVNKPELKDQFLQPMLKWIFATIWPYAVGIMCINFLLTIAAVSLVLYVYKR